MFCSIHRLFMCYNCFSLLLHPNWLSFIGNCHFSFIKIVIFFIDTIEQAFSLAQVLIFLWHKTWTLVKWNNGILISIILASSINDQNEKFFYNLLKVQMQNAGKGVIEKNIMEFSNVERDMQVGHDTFFMITSS